MSNAQKGEAAMTAVAVSVVASMAAAVFGGCCSNVWTYERLLKTEATIGPALTFAQMTFIALSRLPSFLTWPKSSPYPHLKPRAVPLRTWAAQVVVFAGGSVLNNAAYAFDVPLSVQIVFRSAGLAVSMAIGLTVMGRRYSVQQSAAVALVTSGVLLATLSRPSHSSSPSTPPPDPARYAMGITLLLLSLLLTGILGLLQERAYAKYGPHWQEGVFYTHALSLPLFAPLAPSVMSGLVRLGKNGGWMAYAVLGANLLSQLACVSAVNRLSSRVSAVSTQVVLTARKALSLCLSVWWFNNGWNAQLAIGASGVFVGSAWYALSPQPAASRPQPATTPPAASHEKREAKAPLDAKVERVAPERPANGAANGADPQARKAARRRRKAVL